MQAALAPVAMSASGHQRERQRRAGLAEHVNGLQGAAAERVELAEQHIGARQGWRRFGLSPDRQRQLLQSDMINQTRVCDRTQSRSGRTGVRGSPLDPTGTRPRCPQHTVQMRVGLYIKIPIFVLTSGDLRRRSDFNLRIRQP